MKFIIDHDYHIHSNLSSCSSDPQQTNARILQYARENGLKEICLTDHFWDETVPGASFWYQPQNFKHICRALPLPREEQIWFYFGCETDMDRFFTLGIAPETFEKFDFVIVPTTHLHMMGFTLTEEDDTIARRRELYIKRLEALLAMDLPFHKMGLAHLSCALMAPKQFEDHLAVLDGIADETFTRLFVEIAEKGMGVELNIPIFEYTEKDLERVLRPYRIAKACGCKFYFGSDAHHPKELDTARDKFAYLAELLALTEQDKFHPFGRASNGEF